MILQIIELFDKMHALEEEIEKAAEKERDMLHFEVRGVREGLLFQLNNLSLYFFIFLSSFSRLLQVVQFLKLQLSDCWWRLRSAKKNTN